MPSETARVSVVVPAYNEAARIAETLASAFAQSLPPFEVIVVDDGSSDATAEVAAAAGARVISQSNGGISRARNRGLAEARGDFVALLDADDLWLPQRLAWFERTRRACPDAGFFFCDHTVDENGVPNAPSHLATTAGYRDLPRSDAGDGVVAVAGAALARGLALGNFLATSSIVVRRSLVEAHALTFDERLPLRAEGYQVSEDVEWYLRVLRHTDAAGEERVLARYVRRPGRLADRRGAVRYGDAKLGERVSADPERYAAGLPEAFRSARRAQQREAASLFARDADFASAGRILREAQRERFVPRDEAALVLLALADRSAFRALVRLARSAWRGRLRPAARALARRASR